jgi:hypothetical protein
MSQLLLELFLTKKFKIKTFSSTRPTTGLNGFLSKNTPLPHPPLYFLTNHHTENFSQLNDHYRQISSFQSSKSHFLILIIIPYDPFSLPVRAFLTFPG